MAEIVFNKDDNKWVAEFEVSADFNLHIEKSQIGYLYMQQRSTSGKWDSVRNFQVAENDYIVDYDFAALVYPKQIRLVSEYAPTMCALTSDGDVIEIKSQSKEVEITQNGEMSVTPDDGFAYLSSVNVKTNVPQQGGGESGGDVLEGDWEYYDCSNSTEMAEYATYFSGIVKKAEVRDDVMSKIKIGCYLFAYCSSDYDKPIALAIDYSQSCVDANGERTLREQIALYPESEMAQLAGMLQSLPQITKEEFYNLES